MTIYVLDALSIQHQICNAVRDVACETIVTLFVGQLKTAKAECTTLRIKFTWLVVRVWNLRSMISAWSPAKIALSEVEPAKTKGDKGSEAIKESYCLFM